MATVIKSYLTPKIIMHFHCVGVKDDASQNNNKCVTCRVDTDDEALAKSLLDRYFAASGHLSDYNLAKQEIMHEEKNSRYSYMTEETISKFEERMKGN